MSESAETSIARLQERIAGLVAALERSEESKAEQHRWMGTVDSSLQNISNRVKNVEDSLAKSAPTIEEFITIKHKVVGAGQLGKVLWTVGGFVLGVAVAFRKTLAAFISGT